MTSWKTVTCLLVNFRGCQVLEKPVYVIQSVSALIPPPSSELWAGVRKEDGVWVRAFHSYCTICSVSIYHMCTWSSLDWFHTLWAGRSPVQYTKSNWNGNKKEESHPDHLTTAANMSSCHGNLPGHSCCPETPSGSLVCVGARRSCSPPSSPQPWTHGLPQQIAWF